jgi:trypsin
MNPNRRDRRSRTPQKNFHLPFIARLTMKAKHILRWILLLPVVIIADTVTDPSASPTENKVSFIKTNETCGYWVLYVPFSKSRQVPRKLTIGFFLDPSLLYQEATDSKFLGDPRIIGGEEAPEGRYPFPVSLVDSGGDHICGGSLIAPDVVLSAAHCANSFASVEIQRHDRTDPTDQFETFAIVQEIVHPLYDDSRYEYDQMLVILDGQSSATPVAINRDPSVPAVGAEVTAMGWGITDGKDPASLSPVLKQATLFVISNEECEQSKSGNFWFDSYQGQITDDMLCATDQGEDSCQGDSGGPLVIAGTSGDVLVGVVSWGYGCAMAAFPGVYSRVSYDADWIDSTVCSHSENIPSEFSCPPPGTPTAPPPTASAPPTTPAGGEIEVTVAILLDEYPQDIGWRIDRIGLTVDEVFRAPVGIYNTPSVAETRTVLLEQGELYSFSIFDIFGDGLCCDYGEGAYQVSLGTSDITDESAIIIGPIRSFGYGMDHTFLASFDNDQPENPVDSSPGDGPFLTLQIQFDEYPDEIGWILRSDYGGTTAQARMEGRQTTNTVAFRSPRYYNSTVASQLVTETIPVPAENAEYTFILTDSFGDGLCCESGSGSYSIFNGPAENQDLLASGDANGSSGETKDFTLTFTPNTNPTTAPESTSSTSSGSASAIFSGLAATMALALWLTSFS